MEPYAPSSTGEEWHFHHQLKGFPGVQGNLLENINLSPFNFLSWKKKKRHKNWQWRLPPWDEAKDSTQTQGLAAWLVGLSSHCSPSCADLPSLGTAQTLWLLSAPSPEEAMRNEVRKYIARFTASHIHYFILGAVYIYVCIYIRNMFQTPHKKGHRYFILGNSTSLSIS